LGWEHPEDILWLVATMLDQLERRLGRRKDIPADALEAIGRLWDSCSAFLSGGRAAGC